MLKYTCFGVYWCRKSKFENLFWNFTNDSNS